MCFFWSNLSHLWQSFIIIHHPANFRQNRMIPFWVSLVTDIRTQTHNCDNKISSKNIFIFGAAPPERFTQPILTLLGFKWPLKNGPWSCQEKIEVFKMLHCKKMPFKVLSRKQCVITGFPVLTLYCYKCNSQ